MRCAHLTCHRLTSEVPTGRWGFTCARVRRNRKPETLRHQLHPSNESGELVLIDLPDGPVVACYKRTRRFDFLVGFAHVGSEI